MRVRTIEVLRGGWGAVLLIFPKQVLTRAYQLDVDTRSVAVARVLGARHLTQAALSGLEPTPAVLALGAWVDLVHAGSAVGLAVVDHDRARAGLTDALVAVTWAGFGYSDLRRETVRDAHERRRSAWARRVLSWAPGGSLLRPLVERDSAGGPAFG